MDGYTPDSLCVCIMFCSLDKNPLQRTFTTENPKVSIILWNLRTSILDVSRVLCFLRSLHNMFEIYLKRTENNSCQYSFKFGYTYVHICVRTSTEFQAEPFFTAGNNSLFPSQESLSFLKRLMLLVR